MAPLHICIFEFGEKKAGHGFAKLCWMKDIQELLDQVPMILFNSSVFDCRICQSQWLTKL